MKKSNSVVEWTRKHESTAVNTFGLGIDPPNFTRGEGALLWTEDGRRFIDLVSGSAVSNLGHGNPGQKAAIQKELASGVLHTGTRLPAGSRAELYRELTAIFPSGLDAVHLMNSGSEAVETALKAAQYITGRRDVIAFYGGYHGRTLGSLSVTAMRQVRKPFLPLPSNVHFFPYPYPFRPPLPGSDGDTIGEHCLEYLRKALLNPASGVDEPCALIVEAIQGVGGVVVPPQGFLRGIREICNDFDIIMILDEIWTGFGRTGLWFAFQHDDVIPDMVALGKAMSGSLPLAGVVSSDRLLKSWPSGMHTSTFQGNPLACAAAVSNIRQIKEEKLLEYVQNTVEPMLKSALNDLVDLPSVGETRVIGALAGIEFVKKDGSADSNASKEVQRACMEQYVLAYSGGWYGNVVMLVPPFVITNDDLDQALNVIIEVIRALGPS